MNFYPSKKGGNKDEQHTVLVFPANSAIGYETCKGLCHGENKETVHEVLAVCNNSKDQWVDKLKEMGKHVKVICIDQPMREENWKRHLKGQRVECMMLITAPNHHMAQGGGRGRRMDETAERGRMGEMVRNFVRSLEVPMEMAKDLKCKNLVMTMAMGANDSEYKLWHYIFQCMEKTAMKHFKAKDVMMLCHNMLFEILFLNKEEIQHRHMLPWPVSENCEACPLSLCDMGTCCASAVLEMMGEEKGGDPGERDERDVIFVLDLDNADVVDALKKRGNKKMDHLKITGRDKMTPRDMIDAMSHGLNMDIQYHQVHANQYKSMLMRKRMMTPLQIQAIIEMFQMMEDGHLAKCSNDSDDLMDKKPEHFDKWLQDHANDFSGGPGNGKKNGNGRQRQFVWVSKLWKVPFGDSHFVYQISFCSLAAQYLW